MDADDQVSLDNAMIALGFARYGLKREAARIFTGLVLAGLLVAL